MLKQNFAFIVAVSDLFKVYAGWRRLCGLFKWGFQIEFLSGRRCAAGLALSLNMEITLRLFFNLAIDLGEYVLFFLFFLFDGLFDHIRLRELQVSQRSHLLLLVHTSALYCINWIWRFVSRLEIGARCGPRHIFACNAQSRSH